MDRTISELILRCRHFFLQNEDIDTNIIEASEPFKRIEASLSKALVGISILQESLYEGWEADQGSPGYLVRTSRSTAMKVPFHLVPVFPTTEHIEDVWKISRKIKSAPSSVLCISGSVNLYGALGGYNDLDFCEYLNHSDSAVVEGIIEKIKSPQNPYCLEAKLSGQKFLKPFDLELFSTVAAGINIEHPERSHGKLDFVVADDDLLPHDVTNVLIFCDDYGKSAAKVRTFAAQEAILDEAVWSPTKLTNPFDLGRYINWLVEEMLTLASEGKHLKALKRALSFSRVSVQPELTMEITKLCKSHPNVFTTEVAEIEKLGRLIEGSSIPEKENMLKRLAIERQLKEAEISKIWLLHPTNKETFEDAASRIIGAAGDKFRELSYEV